MRNNPDNSMSLLQTLREKEIHLVITNRIDHEECWSESLNPTVGFAEVCFSSAYVLRASPKAEAWSRDFSRISSHQNQDLLFMGVLSMV